MMKPLITKKRVTPQLPTALNTGGWKATTSTAAIARSSWTESSRSLGRAETGTVGASCPICCEGMREPPIDEPGLLARVFWQTGSVPDGGLMLANQDRLCRPAAGL